MIFGKIRGRDTEPTDDYGLACLERQEKYTDGLGDSKLQITKSIRLLVDPILYVFKRDLMSVY